MDKALWGETFLGREASQDVQAALCVRAIEAGFQVHIRTGREPHRFAVLPVRCQGQVVEDGITHGALECLQGLIQGRIQQRFQLQPPVSQRSLNDLAPWDAGCAYQVERPLLIAAVPAWVEQNGVACSRAGIATRLMARKGQGSMVADGLYAQRARGCGHDRDSLSAVVLGVDAWKSELDPLIPVIIFLRYLHACLFIEDGGNGE